MPTKYASGKYAIAQCDRCDQRFKLKELRIQTLKTKPYRVKVCKECWDPDHPQLQLGMYPVNDPQAVREPRPDVSYISSGTSGLQINLTGEGPLGIGGPEMGSRQIQWGWNPVGGGSNWPQTPNDLVSGVLVGTVTVEITEPSPGPAPGAPVITTCSPPVSPSAGGGTAYLIGSGMTGLTAVDFGGTAGTSIVVIDDTTATVTIPAHAVGSVAVSATNPYGTGVWGSTFTYY